MSNIDKQALEKAAEKALQGKWDYEAGAIWNTDESGMVQHMAAVEAGDDISDEQHKSNMCFITLATPAVLLGLLDELYESKSAEANESSCANSVIDSVIKWQTRVKDAEAKLEAAEKRIAELEAREVKLPELCVGVVQGGHAVMVPCAAGHWFNKTAILEMLTDAGINIAAGTAKGE